MEALTDARCGTDRAISAPRQILLVAGVLVLGMFSVWVFTHGIEPRPILGGNRPHALSALAGICIAAWGYLLVFLFRRMFRRRLSTGSCPILLAGVFAIIFLLLGCFGKWAGV